jgi:hypothetical protein
LLDRIEIACQGQKSTCCSSCPPPPFSCLKNQKKSTLQGFGHWADTITNPSAVFFVHSGSQTTLKPGWACVVGTDGALLAVALSNMKAQHEMKEEDSPLSNYIH